jgi:hypothetical protein
MLGEGSLSLSNFDRGEGKYSMTMDVYSLNSLNYLNQTIYSQFTDKKIYAYPNSLLHFLNIKIPKELIIILELKYIQYLQLCIVYDINEITLKTNL